MLCRQEYKQKGIKNFEEEQNNEEQEDKSDEEISEESEEEKKEPEDEAACEKEVKSRKRKVAFWPVQEGILCEESRLRL